MSSGKAGTPTVHIMTPETSRTPLPGCATIANRTLTRQGRRHGWSSGREHAALGDVLDPPHPKGDKAATQRMGIRARVLRMRPGEGVLQLQFNRRRLTMATHG